MSRYFAVPVLAAMLALAGVRTMATSAQQAEALPVMVVSLPQQEPEAPAPAPAPMVAPHEIWEATPPATVPSAPKTEPTVIILEPIPQPAPASAKAAAGEPEVRTVVVERTVYVPQPTVVYAPTNIYYPAVEPAPESRQEAVEIPVIIVVNPPHGRPVPATRRPAVQQDPFFKEIPFMPATPRGPRWNP